ncbi:MAG: toxin-antitoxin system, antitoxin component, Xre family protein [Deltaproteobacteria bacterium]|nr:toxin-antitoxin system, antitoxin component, Xre family protein [Deltaproteobacteria bacterium]
MNEEVLREQILIKKIKALPLDKFAEVEDFVDFLHQRDEENRLKKAAARLSEKAFQEVWDNPEDADYDRL